MRVPLLTQVRCTSITLALTVALSACSGGSRNELGPSSPEDAIHQFMQAAKSNNLETMGMLWGTENKAAYDLHPREELERRLTVMRLYLQNESYQVRQAAPGTVLRASDKERHYILQLARQGCRPEIPITLVAANQGWRIVNIDIAKSGTPGRRCR